MTTTPKKKSTPRTVRYGYKPAGRTGAVTKDADQQRIIDYIVRQKHADFSYASIADMLNVEGVKAARGGAWHGQAVANVYAQVTNERMARIEKEDDAERAKSDAEAEVARAEHDRLASPEHQFETRRYYDEQGASINPDTGDIEGSDVTWTDKAKYDSYKARDDAMTAARLAKGAAMHQAYLALTDKERADLYKFDLPWRTRPGQSREKVDEVVEKVSATPYGRSGHHRGDRSDVRDFGDVWFGADPGRTWLPEPHNRSRRVCRTVSGGNLGLASDEGCADGGIE